MTGRCEPPTQRACCMARVYYKERVLRYTGRGKPRDHGFEREWTYRRCKLASVNGRELCGVHQRIEDRGIHVSRW